MTRTKIKLISQKNQLKTDPNLKQKVSVLQHVLHFKSVLFAINMNISYHSRMKNTYNVQNDQISELQSH